MKKDVSCISKMNFIIWSYLEDPIRVGESKNLSKTIPIDASPQKGGCGNPTLLSLRGFP